MIIAQTKTIDKMKPIFMEYLEHMSQFYEIKNYEGWCIGAIKSLEEYTVSCDRRIYLAMESGRIIGFALVSKHLRFNRDGFGLAEFYIRKRYSRKGHGRRLAEHLFERYLGNWEVAVTMKNKAAQAFWEDVVSSYTRGGFIKKSNNSFNGYGFIFNNEL